VRVLTRLAPVALVAAGLVGAAALDERSTATDAVRFGEGDRSPMPAAFPADALTSSWFCPGVPVGPGVSSRVSLLNLTEADVVATVTVHPTGGRPTTVAVTARGFARTEVALADAGAPAGHAAALVEVAGAGLLAEQVAVTPAGRASSPCATAPSPTWFVADGASTTEVTNAVTLFNPFPDDLVVDVTATTEEGTRASKALQGLVVAPRSLRVVDLGDTVKAKERVAVAAVARTGRFVLGRLQTASGARRELAAGLGAPAPATSWTFAAAPKQNGLFTRFTIFNPDPTDAEVSLTLYPAGGSPGSNSTATASGATPAAGAGNPPIRRTVKARSSVLINLAELTEVPDGAYAAVLTANAGVVVERVLAAGDGRAAVQFGARAAAQRWWFVGAAGPLSTRITVFNATGVEATATVERVGPAGPTAVAGIAPLALPPGGSGSVVFEGPLADGPFVVVAEQPVVVERLESTDQPPAWSTSSGIPELR